MKNFFKYMFASALGTVVALMAFSFLSVAIFAGIVSSMEDDKEVTVKDNSVLRLDFSSAIVDQSSKDPFEGLDFGPFGGSSSTSLRDVIKSIEKAKTDDKIKGIYLRLSGIPAGMASVEEIRNALLDFKSSGKFIIAYSESGYSKGAYYVASVANQIYLYPEAEMDMSGLASELTFFAGMLEKLGVEVQVIRPRNNKFKSALEPFMYDKMSEANREQTRTYLSALWNQMVTGIAAERDMSADQINAYADSLKAGNSKMLQELGYIDGTRYHDEMLAELMDSVNVEDEDDFHFVKLGKYMDYMPEGSADKKDYKLKEKVAIVYAEGEIVSGKGGDGEMGSTTIMTAIKKARTDSNVKAIVLRVNSPGGSALASDIMWRETQLAKSEKPFVVSMGNVAASGGYYISAGADRIFAQPNTITGSIGVFGMIPNLQGFMRDKLGITTDTVKTNLHSDWGTTSRPMTAYEREIITGYVETVYDTFLTRVSDGRGMEKSAVDAIAQGRVWAGTDALEIGLVDELGSLQDAIDYASEMAELEDYKIVEYPEQKDPFEEFTKKLSGAEEKIVEKNLGHLYPYLQRMKQVEKMNGVYTRMPYYLDIY